MRKEEKKRAKNRYKKQVKREHKSNRILKRYRSNKRRVYKKL